MPEYYEYVTNLRKRLESYRAGYAKATVYDKWMYGRRVGEYQGHLAESAVASTTSSSTPWITESAPAPS